MGIRSSGMPGTSPSRAELEKARAVVRALHLTELEQAGEARAAALAQAESELHRISARLEDALDAGISLTEIARVTGVSRPTLYDLLARLSDSPRDLSLALLQLIATKGSLPVSNLAAEMRRPEPEYRSVLDGLIGDGLVTYDVDESAERVEGQYVLTSKGYDLLDNWEFIDWDKAPTS
jgi:transcriptional regulator with XRE-family HTH domain